MAIKYHLKCSNKGPDKAIITVEGKIANKYDNYAENNENAPTNEVKEFQNKWYVSDAEAYWRFRENEIAEQKIQCE